MHGWTNGTWRPEREDSPGAARRQGDGQRGYEAVPPACCKLRLRHLKNVKITGRMRLFRVPGKMTK